MITALWDDHEINGRIFLQANHLFLDFLFKNQTDPFLHHASIVMHKVSATKYHLKNYEKIEIKQCEEWRKRFKKDLNMNAEAFELIFELEAFLYQIKSSLDMLVKLLIPILGRGMVKTRTYKDKGTALIKGLRQYQKKKGVNIHAIENLISLIEQNKLDWINKAVDIRDKLNHDEGLKNYTFTPKQLPNGVIVVLKPKFEGEDTTNLMRTIYMKNLEFHQDFMSLALFLIAPQFMILMPQDTEQALQQYDGAPSAKYIKWCFGVNVPNNPPPHP